MCSIEEESIAIGNSFATNADNAVPLNNDAHSLQYTQQSIIYVPQAEKKIGWSLREINKAKEICFTAQKNTFPWAEVLLGISWVQGSDPLDQDSDEAEVLLGISWVQGVRNEPIAYNFAE